MKDNGRMTKQKAMADYVIILFIQCIVMEMSMMVNGRMIWLMEKELIHMQEVPVMKEIGLMINNMDLEPKFGQMVLNMKFSNYSKY